MSSMFQKAVQLFAGDDVTLSPGSISHLGKLKKMSERELLALESEIGAKLFGPVPSGHRREFFCLDENTWIWHEEWMESRKLKTQTVRYEIQDKGVLKVQEGARYSYLDGEELRNFVIAVHMYYEQVTRAVYHRDPSTGKRI